MSGFEISGDNELHLADFALMPHNNKFDLDLDFEVLARICMSASVHDVDEMSAVSDMWRRFLIYDTYLYIAKHKRKDASLVTVARLLQSLTDTSDPGDRVAEEYGIRMILDWRTCPVAETTTILESAATHRMFLATRRNKLYKYGHRLVETHTLSGNADTDAPLAYLSEHTFLSPTIGPKVGSKFTVPVGVLIPTISTRAIVSDTFRNVRLCDRTSDHRTEATEIEFGSFIFAINSHARMLNLYGKTEVGAIQYVGPSPIDAPVLQRLPFSLRTTTPKPPPSQENIEKTDVETLLRQIRTGAGSTWSDIKERVEVLIGAISVDKKQRTKKKGVKTNILNEAKLTELFTSLDHETQVILIGHVHRHDKSLFNYIFSHGKRDVAHLIDNDWSARDWIKSAFEQYVIGILNSDDPATDYALHTFKYSWRLIETILTIPPDALPQKKPRIRNRLISELENLLFELDYETVANVLNKEKDCIDTVLRLGSDSSALLSGLFAVNAQPGALGRIFAGLHNMANSLIIFIYNNVDNTELIKALGNLIGDYMRMMLDTSQSGHIALCLKAMHYRMADSFDMQSIIGFAFGSGKVEYSPEIFKSLHGLFGQKTIHEDDELFEPTIMSNPGTYASARFSLYAPLEFYTKKTYWPIDAYVAGKISEKDVPTVSDESVVEKVRGHITTPDKIDWAIKKYGNTNPIVRFYCARVLSEQKGHYLRIGDDKWPEIKSEPDTVTIETSATAT